MARTKQAALSTISHNRQLEPRGQLVSHASLQLPAIRKPDEALELGSRDQHDGIDGLGAVARLARAEAASMRRSRRLDACKLLLTLVNFVTL